MKTLLTGIVLMTLSWAAVGQTFTEKINKDLSFEKKSTENAVIVANINGDVTVTGYEGDHVLVEVTKTIKGKTQERLEKGKKDIQVGVINRADTLLLFMEGGCNVFGRLNGKNDRNKPTRWGYNWNCNNGCRDCCDTPYDYTLDFNIKVPAGINLVLSTVNDGNIKVENVKGSVYTNNVNGSIKLANLASDASASTINGDVDIEYDRNPQKECRFYTLNGNINAWFQKGLAANMSFESFNGEFYTNINQLESLPPIVEKKQKGEGVRYKVNGNRYKIGSGGVYLDFETFNGDVYLKEKTN